MSLSVNCDCGKSLRVSEEKRGKRIKCPACSEVIRVPDSDDEEVNEDPVPRARSAKTRKKKGKAKGGASVAPLAIACGVGLVVLVVVGAILFWPKVPVAKPDVVAMPVSVVTPAGGHAERPKEVLGTPDSWQPFNHTAGGFTVSAPGVLNRVPQREEKGTEFYGLQIPGSRPYACSINYQTFPRNVTAGKKTAFILQTAAKILSEPDQIVEQSTIQHQGYEGLEILVKGPKRRPHRSRLFFHRGAVIDFTVMWEKDAEPIAESDQFWNSIQFTP